MTRIRVNSSNFVVLEHITSVGIDVNDDSVVMIYTDDQKCIRVNQGNAENARIYFEEISSKFDE